MEKALTTDEIIREAFKGQDPFVINEISRETAIKFLGETNVDLYITTNKIYVEKRVRSNLVNIQNAITKLSDKTIRDIYINQQLVELSIKELKNKESIKTIDVNDFKKERTEEISGENNIVKQSGFKYEASIFNRKRINIELYNKSLNKQFKTEINTSMLTSFTLYFQRKKLIKKLKGLVYLKYEAVNNDTQEVIKYLKIEK